MKKRFIILSGILVGVIIFSSWRLGWWINTTSQGYLDLLSEPSRDESDIQRYVTRMSKEEFVNAALLDMKKKKDVTPELEERIRLYFAKVDEQAELKFSKPFKEINNPEQSLELNHFMEQDYPELIEGW